MTKAEISPCTRADYIEFFGKEPERSIKAYAVRWKNELVCIAGIALDSGLAFSDMKPNDAPKSLVWRTAQQLFDLIKQPGLITLCTPGSEKFLQKLGFSHLENGIYKWQR